MGKNLCHYEDQITLGHENSVLLREKISPDCNRVFIRKTLHYCSSYYEKHITCLGKFVRY